MPGAISTAWPAFSTRCWPASLRSPVPPPRPSWPAGWPTRRGPSARGLPRGPRAWNGRCSALSAGFPTDRFPGVAAFAAALVQSTPAPDLATRAPGTRRVAGRLGALLLLAVIVLGGWLISQSMGAAPVARDSVTVALFERGRKGY